MDFRGIGALVIETKAEDSAPVGHVGVVFDEVYGDGRYFFIVF